MDGCPGDEALLLAVAGRDMGAFRARYERHAGWLAVRLARRCNDRDLVADAVGDTFVARPGGVTLTVYRWALLVLMTAFLRSLLAGLADDHVIFGALHATDGLLILAIPAYLYVWTGRRAA
jgi:hypothetical protein